MKHSVFFYMNPIILIVFAALILPFTVKAETAYVTDMLILTVKEGPGNEYGVINTLRSNTKLEILNKSGKYYQIRTPDGDEGWVDSHYVTSQIPKEMIIEKLKAKISLLETKLSETDRAAEVSAYEDKIKTLRQTHHDETAKLELSLKEFKEQNIKLNEVLEEAQEKYNSLAGQSKNLLDLIKENKELKNRNDLLSVELKKIKLKREDSFKTSMIKWFLAGAGVLILGWLIGISIRSSRKKRTGLLG